MTTSVENFRNLKDTKGTYLKVLSLAQSINEKQTIAFIEKGSMPELSIEQRQILSLCDALSESHKRPKCVRRENINFSIDLSIKYPIK